MHPQECATAGVGKKFQCFLQVKKDDYIVLGKQKPLLVSTKLSLFK